MSTRSLRASLSSTCAAKDNAEVSPTALLEQKIAELERFYGQLALESALLKKW